MARIIVLLTLLFFPNMVNAVKKNQEAFCIQNSTGGEVVHVHWDNNGEKHHLTIYDVVLQNKVAFPLTASNFIVTVSEYNQTFNFNPVAGVTQIIKIKCPGQGVCYIAAEQIENSCYSK